jgi:hypothetical protein
MIGNLQCSNEELREELKICVEYHMKIKNFVDEMSTNVSFSLFLQSTVSSIILCSSVAVLTTVKIEELKKMLELTILPPTDRFLQRATNIS